MLHIIPFLFQETGNEKAIIVLYYFIYNIRACNCFKQWYINLFNTSTNVPCDNCNYNFNGIINTYDFCHSHATLLSIMN